jgi:acetyltransferase-like isoleucine patch superfamily enzyme
MNSQTLPALLRRLALPVFRLPSRIRAAICLAGTRLGSHVRVLAGGRIQVRGAANITIGDWVWFNSGPLPHELASEAGGLISIGTSTGFNYGVSLRARQSIRIGSGCAFGAMAMVRDDDGSRTAPVVIGDRVWLAHCVIIEPGVTIGDDAVVSAGSVVVEDVPPRMIAIGNPARCLPLMALRRPVGPQAPPPGPDEPLSPGQKALKGP